MGSLIYEDFWQKMLEKTNSVMIISVSGLSNCSLYYFQQNKNVKQKHPMEYFCIMKLTYHYKRKRMNTWLAVLEWELHSSSCPNLHRFDDGLSFSSWIELWWSSNVSSSNPDNWDKLSWSLADAGLFHNLEDIRVLRFLEIQRIGGENALRKGYISSFGMWNIMRNIRLSHLDESWNEKEDSHWKFLAEHRNIWQISRSCTKTHKNNTSMCIHLRNGTFSTVNQSQDAKWEGHQCRLFSHMQEHTCTPISYANKWLPPTTIEFRPVTLRACNSLEWWLIEQYINNFAGMISKGNLKDGQIGSLDHIAWWA